jgi:hypothetical protein
LFISLFPEEGDLMGLIERVPKNEGTGLGQNLSADELYFSPHTEIERTAEEIHRFCRQWGVIYYAALVRS